MHRLVLDLELGSLDSAVEDVHGEGLELDDFVAAVVKRVRWDTDVRLDLASVDVVSDAWSLERILVNLVGNAFRHGGSNVAARVRPAQSGAVIEVSDGGPGIGNDAIPRLFDRFYTRSRATGGSGLGLSIVREHAGRIGAKLEVRSLEGLGTTVTVSLPSLPQTVPWQSREPGEAPVAGPVGR